MGAALRWDALIFDFDGVLADSEPLHWRSWAQTLLPLGFELSWDEYCRCCRGVADDEMFEALHRLTPLAARWAEFTGTFEARKLLVMQWLAEDPRISHDTVDMLRSLPDIPVALVTSATRPEVEPVLLQLGLLDCFDTAVYAEDVERHKPAPDPYLLAGKRLGVRSALVFEDSDAGVASATAAGFEVVRVTDPTKLAEMVRGKIGFPVRTA